MATKDPITPSKTADKNTTHEGELLKFIPQPSPSYLDGDTNSVTITQVFKGPVGSASSLQFIIDGMLTSEDPTQKTLQYWMQHTANEIDWKVGEWQQNAPLYLVLYPSVPGISQQFVIDKYSIEECQPAGLHCIFRVTFKRVHVPQSEEEESNPDYTYWTCQMAQTQIDVLAYCTNKSNKQNDEETGSFATNIQTWMNQTEDTAVLKPNWQYQSVLGAKEIKTLNSAEIAIAQKLIAGQSPLRHYPVVVKNEVYSAKPKVDFSKIDHINDPSGCPFTLTGWKWLCTGINVTYNSTTGVTNVATEWTGSESWDVNFYGSGKDRWQFGMVDTTVVK